MEEGRVSINNLLVTQILPTFAQIWLENVDEQLHVYGFHFITMFCFLRSTWPYWRRGMVTKRNANLFKEMPLEKYHITLLQTLMDIRAAKQCSNIPKLSWTALEGVLDASGKHCKATLKKQKPKNQPKLLILAPN